MKQPKIVIALVVIFLVLAAIYAVLESGVQNYEYISPIKAQLKHN